MDGVARDSGVISMRPPTDRPTMVRAVGGARGHRIDLRRVGNVTVVTLQGEISEQFHGLEVGRRLRGEVVLDLSQVQRITSFGVREWLTMLRELYATRLTLARCSEPFIHQLSMIRSFAGTGRIVSFFAPYVCSSCGTAFSALYDAVRDRHAIDSRLPVPADCPRCSSPAYFDDEPSLYLGLEPHLADELEPQVAAAVGQLDELEGVPIRKAVVGQETWITLNTDVDAALRLQRALDGVEGNVVFDLSAITGATDEGLERLLHRLRGLGPEVQLITLVGCPYALLLRILEQQESRHLTDHRIRVASARVLAYCTASQAQRSVLVDLRVPTTVMALRLGESPQLPTDWCPGPVHLGDAIPVLKRALALAVRPVAPPPPNAALAGRRTVVPEVGPYPDMGGYSLPIEAFAPSMSSMSSGPKVTRRAIPKTSPASTTLVPEPAPMAPVLATPAGAFTPPDWRPISTLVIGIAALASGLLVGATGLIGGLLVANFDGLVARPWAGAPAWVEQSFIRSPDGVELVGLATASSVEDGLSEAREDMTGTLLGHLGRRVIRHGGFELQLPGPGTLSATALASSVAAFQSQAGEFAAPERVDDAVRHGPFGVQVAARYAMTDAQWAAAAEYYSETVDFRGITVARTFPTLVPSLGDGASLVVVATRPWMRSAQPGDVVETVNNRPVDDLDTLRSLLKDQWTETPPGQKLKVGIRRGDSVQVISFGKTRG